MFLVSKLIAFKSSELNTNIQTLVTSLKTNGFTGMAPGDLKAFNYKSCAVNLAVQLGSALATEFTNYSLIPENDLNAKV
jgi:hypothetical protein